MARQQNGSQAALVVVTLMLCGSMFAEAGLIPVPWAGEVLPPEPKPGLWKFLQNYCGPILTNKCGQQLYAYIFHAQARITLHCCYRVVLMGEKCNLDAAYGLSNFHKFKPWKGHIYERSIAAYKSCRQRVEQKLPVLP